MKAAKVQWLILWGCFFALSAQAAELIHIPSGKFQMPTASRAEIAVPAFYLDEKPVSNAEYLAFVKDHPQWRKSQIKKIFSDGEYLSYWSADLKYDVSDKAPVVRVTWYAARAYCQSQGKRLPTLNEWEYAASLPLQSNKDMKKVILEWYGKRSSWPMPDIGLSKNSLGVWDMHGLIWEWVEDFNTAMVTGESRADGSLNRNLFCGGGAAEAADPSDYAAFMRFAFRSSLNARFTVQNLGFRCAQSADEQEEASSPTKARELMTKPASQAVSKTEKRGSP